MNVPSKSALPGLVCALVCAVAAIAGCNRANPADPAGTIRKTSPDNRVEAILVPMSGGVSPGGGTFGTSFQLYLVPAKSRIPSDIGKANLVSDGARSVKISWRSKSDLEVTCDGGRVVHFANFWQTDDPGQSDAVVALALNYRGSPTDGMRRVGFEPDRMGATNMAGQPTPDPSIGADGLPTDPNLAIDRALEAGRAKAGTSDVSPPATTTAATPIRPRPVSPVIVNRWLDLPTGKIVRAARDLRKAALLPPSIPPGATKPGAAKPGATKPGATKPGATKPGATKPAVGATPTPSAEPTPDETGRGNL